MKYVIQWKQLYITSSISVLDYSSSVRPVFNGLSLRRRLVVTMRSAATGLLVALVMSVSVRGIDDGHHINCTKQVLKVEGILRILVGFSILVMESIHFVRSNYNEPNTLIFVDKN